MIKIELYKNGDLVLSSDGKIDDQLLVFGNIVYDLDKDVLIREDASFRYLLDFKNSTSEIIIKEQHNCRSTDYWEKQNNNFLLLAHEYIFVFQK